MQTFMKRGGWAGALKLGGLMLAVGLLGTGVGGCSDGSGMTGPAMSNSGRVQAIVMREVVTLSAGQSSLVEFLVPEDTLSLGIVVEGRDEGEYTIADWSDEAGVELVRPNWWATEDYVCNTCPNTVAWQVGGFAAIAPDNPMSTINSGLHRLRIEGAGITEDVVLTVWAKRGAALPSEGVLDLRFYFTGTYEWNADAAQSSDYFASVISRVDEVLGGAGLRVGEMSFVDIEPEWAVINSTYGPSNDLASLLQQSRGGDANELSVFFVDKVFPGSSDEPRASDSIIGLSPSPGPPLTQGTVNSGIVVTTWSTLSIPEEERWPNALAHTIVHEAGHHLGLAHTTEFDGTTHDRLPDTADDDRGNLMHADPDPELGTISPWQSRVLRGSMWIRHPENDEMMSR